MKRYLFLLLSVSALTSSTCKKDFGGPYIPAHSLFFLIKKGGARLPDSILNNMQLYYYQGGSKKYLSDFTRGINEGGFQAYDLGIQTTRNIGYISGNENTKDYYLEYPDGSLDTLFVDYRHLSESDAKNDPCYCYYPLREVKFNGQVAATDPSITVQKVYSFIIP